MRSRWLVLAAAFTLVVGVAAAVGGRTGSVTQSSDRRPPLAASTTTPAAAGAFSRAAQSSSDEGGPATITAHDPGTRFQRPSTEAGDGTAPRPDLPAASPLPSSSPDSSAATGSGPARTGAAAASSTTYTSSAAEPFNRGWFERWGLTQPENTFVLPGLAGNYLEVRIPAGAHDGTSFLLPMPDAEVAHLHYRIRLGDTFDPSQAAGNVKIPGFGNPSLDPHGSCLAACGLAVADGLTAYSARSELRTDGVPGWYVYDVDSALHADYGRSEVWDFPGFAKGRWYTIDEYIRMNTPGVNDGRLATLVDGHPVFERDTVLFRTVSTLKVGNAWFDIYFGGNGVAPHDMFVDFDNVLMEWG